MGVIGLDISFVVGGQEGKDIPRRISFAFERARSQLYQFSKYVWPNLVQQMEQAEEAQFDAEGQGPAGGHWAALSPRYAEWKAKHYPGTPILERSGNLRSALTDASSPFAARAESEAELVFGSQGVEYASYHQSGTTRMVARPPIDFGDDFEETARRAVAAGIRDALLDGELGQFAEVTPGGDE